jgi:hypothetical protein
MQARSSITIAASRLDHRRAIDERRARRYCSAMIPPFDATGKLPPGIHWAM